MRTVTKLSLAGLGLYLVSQVLKKVSDNAPTFAPRGMGAYQPQMVGYDPLAEAIGCVNGSFEEQGLAGFGSKLKGAVSKATSVVTKVAKKPLQVVKRDVSKVAKQVKRDAKNVTKPLVRDFRKAGKLVKHDFTKAAKLMKNDFRSAAALSKALTGKKPQQQQEVAGGNLYLDENGNEITEAQYHALMAQYEQEYGMTPGIIPDGAVQSDDGSPTYSMDQTAADFFAQEQNQPVTDGQPEVDILAYAQGYADETGFADGTVPYTGGQMWDMPTGYDYDPLAAFYLPQDIQDDTMDVYGASMTSGDNLIMPAGEPSAPYTGDELWIGYEDADSVSRGASWNPEPSGHGYGNPLSPSSYAGEQGGVPMPGYWENYGGFDWNWENDGLGDLVLKPGAHKNASPAVLSMLRSQQKPNTYGYFMRSPKQQRTSPPIIFKADKKGMVYAKNGGGLHRVGPLAKLAQAMGLGCECFGRDMGVSGLGGFFDFIKKAEDKAKKVASYITPSGAAAAYFKKHDRKHYKETTKALGVAKPYALIVGGTALTVFSVGAASPAGVGMIASGVVSLGAQGYSDIATHEAEKDLDRLIEEDRLNSALYSTDVINQTQRLNPQGGPSAGEIPGGDWPWEYAGDGVWADFLNLVGMNPN